MSATKLWRCPLLTLFRQFVNMLVLLATLSQEWTKILVDRREVYSLVRQTTLLLKEFALYSPKCKIDYMILEQVYRASTFN